MHQIYLRPECVFWLGRFLSFLFFGHWFIFHFSAIRFIFIIPFHFILLSKVFFKFQSNLFVVSENPDGFFFADYEFVLHFTLENLTKTINAFQLTVVIDLSGLIKALILLKNKYRFIINSNIFINFTNSFYYFKFSHYSNALIYFY